MTRAGVDGARTGRFLRAVGSVSAIALLCSLVLVASPAHAAAPCLSGWDRQMPTAESPDEVPYLDKILVCVEGSTGAVVVKNNSNMVWSFIDAVQGDVWYEQWSEKSGAFYEMFTELNLSTSPILVPGDQVRLLADRATRWVIDGRASVLWAGMGELYSVVAAAQIGAIKAAVTKGSLTRKALWTCGSTLAEFLETRGDSSGSITGKQVVKALGLTAATSLCAKDWKAAAAKRSWFPSWGDDLVAIGKSAEVAKKLGTYASRASQAAELFCGFIPRFC